MKATSGFLRRMVMHWVFSSPGSTMSGPIPVSYVVTAPPASKSPLPVEALVEPGPEPGPPAPAPALAVALLPKGSPATVEEEQPSAKAAKSVAVEKKKSDLK